MHDTLLMKYTRFSLTTLLPLQSLILATGNRNIFSRNIACILFRGWLKTLLGESNTISTPSRPRRRKPRAQARVLTDGSQITRVFFADLQHWICRCTLMYTLLRSIKIDTAPVRQARKLYLLGDNFSEVQCCVESFSKCVVDAV